MKKSPIFYAWVPLAFIVATLCAPEAVAGGADQGPSASGYGKRYSAGLGPITSATSFTVAHSTAIALENDPVKEALKAVARFTRNFLGSFVEHLVDLHKSGMQEAKSQVVPEGIKQGLNVVSPGFGTGFTFAIDATEIVNQTGALERAQLVANKTTVYASSAAASIAARRLGLGPTAQKVAGSSAAVVAAYSVGVANKSGEYYGDAIDRMLR